MSQRNDNQLFNRAIGKMNCNYTYKQLKLNKPLNPLKAMFLKFDNKLRSFLSHASVTILIASFVLTMGLGSFVALFLVPIFNAWTDLNSMFDMIVIGPFLLCVSLIYFDFRINASFLADSNILETNYELVSPNKEITDDRITEINTNNFNKLEICQLLQHANDLAIYQKNKNNMALLPAEWQWLKQKGYQLEINNKYGSDSKQFSILKNSLVICQIVIDSKNEVNFMQVFNVEDKAKPKQKLKLKKIGSLICLLIAYVFFAISLTNSAFTASKMLLSWVFASGSLLFSFFGMTVKFDSILEFHEQLNKLLPESNIRKLFNLVTKYLATSKYISRAN